MKAPPELHEEFQAKLTDGTNALYRTIRPDDKERIREGFKQLSERTRYLRFFSYMEHLSDEQLHYLTDVDQQMHVAWAVMDLDHPDVPGIGAGRFVRTEKNPENAEMAITVVDHYQHKGAGKTLFGVLYQRARELNVRNLQFYIMPSNRFLCSKLNELGAAIQYEEGIFNVELPVYKDFSRFERDYKARYLRKLTHKIQQYRNKKQKGILEQLLEQLKKGGEFRG